MSTAVQRIPDRYKAATPYLSIKDAAAALDFYKRAFGKVMHAEIMIGQAPVMMADECPEMGFRSPQAIGGSPVTIHVYVEDVDALAARATEAGAEVLQPVEGKFYGDRSVQLRDPFGHIWNFATHVEDVSEEEIGRRAQAFLESHGAA